MKKWKKVLLIIRGTALVLGICCIVLGFILGGSTKAIENATGDYFDFRIGNHGLEFWGNRWNNDDISSTDAENKEFSDITEMDIESKYSEVIMKGYAGSTIKVSAQKVSPRKYSMKNDNDVLTITDHTARSSNSPKITIQIPTDYKFDDVDINVYGGKVTIDELNTDEFDADIGAGKLQVTGKLTSPDVSCEVGAGSIDLRLLESSDVSLECGAGEIKTCVYGKQSDYYLEGDCGIGEIQFGTEKFSGNTQNIEFGSGNNEIDADCGVGHIDIRFQDNKI